MMNEISLMVNFILDSGSLLNVTTLLPLSRKIIEFIYNILFFTEIHTLKELKI